MTMPALPLLLVGLLLGTGSVLGSEKLQESCAGARVLCLCAPSRCWRGTGAWLSPKHLVLAVRPLLRRMAAAQRLRRGELRHGRAPTAARRRLPRLGQRRQPSLRNPREARRSAGVWHRRDGALALGSPRRRAERHGHRRAVLRDVARRAALLEDQRHERTYTQAAALLLAISNSLGLFLTDCSMAQEAGEIVFDASDGPGLYHAYYSKSTIPQETTRTSKGIHNMETF